MSKKESAARVLMFEDKVNGGGWSAQCLDYDIAMQAKSFQDLIYEISRVLKGHLIVSKELGVEPFTGLSTAPAVYWQVFNNAKTTLVRESVQFGPASSPELSRIIGKVAELQFLRRPNG